MPANALDFSLGYDLAPMRSTGAQAITLNQRVMHAIGSQFRLTEESGKNIGKLFKGIGLASGVAALATGRAVLNLGSEINDMSDAVGLGTDTFQRFSFAISQAGGKQTDFVRGMGALIGKIEEGKDGNEKALASFNKLGITFGDLNRLTPDQILLRIADALKQTGADGASTATVMDLLGSKVALKLIPSLKEGSDAFLKAGDSAKIMSKEAIASIDAMGDTLNKWKVSALSAVGNLFVKENWAALKEKLVGGIERKDGGALHRDELADLKRANDARRAAVAKPRTFDPDIGMLTRMPAGPAAPDRFGVRGLGQPGFNSGLKGASMASFGKFVTAFTPSLQSDLKLGGSTMLGEGRGLGIGGGPTGFIRQGDAARNKAAAKATAEQALVQAAKDTAENTKALVDTWRK